MRIVMFAAAGACIFLACCGGPQKSQANNARANISSDSPTRTLPLHRTRW